MSLSTQGTIQTSTGTWHFIPNTNDSENVDNYVFIPKGETYESLAEKAQASLNSNYYGEDAPGKLSDDQMFSAIRNYTANIVTPEDMAGVMADGSIKEKQTGGWWQKNAPYLIPAAVGLITGGMVGSAYVGAGAATEIGAGAVGSAAAGSGTTGALAGTAGMSLADAGLATAIPTSLGGAAIPAGASPFALGAGGTAATGGSLASLGTAAGTGAITPAVAAGGGTVAANTAGSILGNPWVQAGAGILGLAGSNMGAEAAKDGSEAAAEATRQNTAAQIASQEKMYNQGREDFAPFRNLAPESLANLQSSIYGKPVGYTDTSGAQQTANGQQFDLENFTPEGTAAYDWQKSRTLEDLGNYFNLVGRGKGSTVQSNTTARSLGDLNAAEYDKGYNRLFQRKQDYTNDLLNLVKTAQGAAGSTATIGTSAANNTSQAFQNQGNNLANIAQNQGQTQANFYSGIVPSAMNTLATGLKINDYYNGTKG